jgi:hypothetical protein
MINRRERSMHRWIRAAWISDLALADHLDVRAAARVNPDQDHPLENQRTESSALGSR